MAKYDDKRTNYHSRRAATVKAGRPLPIGGKPLPWDQVPVKQQNEELNDQWLKNLESLAEMTNKYKDGMYDFDAVDTKHPDMLAVGGVPLKVAVSQCETNRLAKLMAGNNNRKAQTGLTMTWGEEDLIKMEMDPGLALLAELVSTVNPYEKGPNTTFSQFPEPLQKLIKTGYDMVDHSDITPWPAGTVRYFEQKCEGKPSIFYKSAMRIPAVFDCQGLPPSEYVESVRAHAATNNSSSPSQRRPDHDAMVGYFASKRNSTTTETQSLHPDIPRSYTPNIAPSNPTSVTFANQTGIGDAWGSVDRQKADRDREMRGVFEKWRATQTGASSVQGSGYGRTETAQTGSGGTRLPTSLHPGFQSAQASCAQESGYGQTGFQTKPRVSFA